MFYCKLSLARVISVCVLSACAFGQATINEALETATVWVDVVNGNDANAGTQSAPYQTITAGINAAIGKNQSSIGTLIQVQPGTYRESVTLNSSTRDTSLPITLQAVTPGTVHWSGATQYTGWLTYSPNPAISTNSWANQWGLCAPDPSGPGQPDITLRREMVYVNGTQLTQVLALSGMAPGTFFVDEGGGTIYIWPAPGVSIQSADVEVASLPALLTFNGKDNWVIRGMNFEYANPCWNNGAVSVNGSTTNILFDSDNFVWNNAFGIVLSAPTYFTVQNSTSNHNGQSGFQATLTNHGLWQNDVASYNNWRGAQGSYFSWNISGAHFFEAHNDILTGLTVAYNQSHGIHWDTDNQNITGTSLTTLNNLLNNVFVEVSEGPVTLDKMVSCYGVNGQQSQSAVQGGLEIRNSIALAVTNSTFYGNNSAQVIVNGTAGGIPGTNWETGQTYNLVTTGLTMTGNTFYGLGTASLFSDSALNNGDWDDFQSTYVGGTNTWWSAQANSFIVPAPAQHTTESFSGWQTSTLQDLTSSAAQPSDPSGKCVAPAIDVPDTWFIGANPTMTVDLTGQTSTSLQLISVGGSSAKFALTADTSSAQGMTASFDNSSISPGSSANLTVVSSFKTPAGTYQIPVYASNGTITRTSTLFVVVPVGSARVSVAALAFPSTTINLNSDAQEVILSNLGSTPLTITSIVTSDSYSSTNDCGASVKASSSCNIWVTFTPGHIAQNIPGTLTITDSDVSSPQIVSLSGQGLAAPNLGLSPSSLYFGNLDVTLVSAPMTSTFTNSSTASVAVLSSIILGGTNPGDFNASNNCPTTLYASSSCTFTVTFSPTTAGSRTASITITDNSTSASHTLNLTGTGVVPLPTVTLSPGSLYFGSVDVTASSPTQTATLTNTSTDPLAVLTISGLKLAGTNPGDFSYTSTCGATLAINTACTFTVTFKPTTAGSRTSTITFTDNTNGGSHTLTLTGTGFVPVPTITLSPGTLSFGNVDLTASSASQTSTLTNTSTDPLAVLNISNLKLGGTNPGDFTYSSTCGATLAMNKSCTFTATFTPTVAAFRTATITYTDNTVLGSHTVNLNGTGVTPVPTATLSPSTLNFGSVTLGVASSAKAATLTNTATDPLAVLNIASIVLGGSSSHEYTATNTCGTTLAVGASCTFTVTFTPTATGTRSATITITDNVKSGSQTLTLTGTGSQPKASVTFLPGTLTFASTKVGTTTASQSATLTNTSTNSYATLAITNFTVTGNNPGDYTQNSSACPTVLNPGASCAVTVTFTPGAKGTRKGNLNANDNGSTTKQTVTLTGTGS